MEKYGTPRQATDDNVIRSVRFACWIIKTRIQTHNQKFYYLLLFHGSNGWVKAPQRYVNVYFFCFSDISFKCSFTSIGKEGSCTEDLIDQDVNLTVAIATMQKIQLFLTPQSTAIAVCTTSVTMTSCSFSTHHVHESRMYLTIHTDCFPTHHQLVLPITDRDIPRQIGTNFCI